MPARPVELLTPEEYLARERAAETKREYVDGLVLEMGPFQSDHVLVTVNITSEISRQLKDRPDSVYAQAMRVWIPEGRMYAYPDVVAVMGRSAFAGEEHDVRLNPTLIIEVVS